MDMKKARWSIASFLVLGVLTFYGVLRRCA